MRSRPTPTATAHPLTDFDDIRNYTLEHLPLLRQARHYRAGMIEVLSNFPANYYAVANFNSYAITPRWCRAQLNRLDVRIARLLLGPSWCTSDKLRPTWIAVPELATYLHYNILWEMPAEYGDAFAKKAPKIWRTLVPAGDLHIQNIDQATKYNLASYVTKAFNPVWTINNIITSQEFRVS